jgi:hypothetical protein
MRIGVCASIDKLPLLKELGYDYIEPHFGRLAALDETEYHKQTREMERFSIAAEAFNCFFEKDMVLYAPNGDQDPLLRQIRTYAERGLARAADDKPDLELISAQLKECPKIDRISLECRWPPDFGSAVTNARPLMEVFKRS